MEKLHNYKTIVGNGYYSMPAWGDHVFARPKLESGAQDNSLPTGSQSPATDLSRARRILGVSAEADVAVVQAAYRALASKFHPDRAGDDVDAAAVAHARFIELKWAYDTIMAAAGGAPIVGR
jgi:hypothetical protein